MDEEDAVTGTSASPLEERLRKRQAYLPLKANANRSASPSSPPNGDAASAASSPGQGYYGAMYDLNRSLSRAGENGVREKNEEHRTLDWLGGVFACVALAEFSTLLFLRLGFVVGQSGTLFTIIQLFLGYFILFMTILSICAISTNGAIEGGGAYYMISRALGPEFGGSIGVLFFLANIFSCALYTSGFVEALVDNFGPGGILLPSNSNGLEGVSRWWIYLYSSVVLLVCLAICLIGGAMFARTSVAILGVVILCYVMVLISSFVKPSSCVPLPANNNLSLFNKSDFQVPEGFCNATDKKGQHIGAQFTGYKAHTFEDNFFSNYTVDYATGTVMDFGTVFAILFSSVTGIMNGANMSGELKDPSKAIPRGTLAATFFTLVIYTLSTFLTAATASRELLINNYNYLAYVNIWSGFIMMGIFAATLSAALGNLIGASRILHALAKDKLFWNLLDPATRVVCSGNPIVAVLVSYVLVQFVLLIGSLNTIAPFTTVLFLLSYASTNLACLALELASAPNFRPTFRFFSSYTCLLGLIGCLIMIFVINWVAAAICLLTLFVLVVLLHLRSLPTSWGSISQALIFHQVRKYLLLLDNRKDHVKFWRPQILLMVSNPRQNCYTIDFINDIKKGGLYILGHVMVGDLNDTAVDPCSTVLPNWLSLIERLKIKAFADITMAGSVREGLHHLMRVSGLGGMKPNTICFGFYDDSPPTDTITHRMTDEDSRRRANRFLRLRDTITGTGSTSDVNGDWSEATFPQTRPQDGRKLVDEQEYTAMIYDAIKFKKNVCILRHFHTLHKGSVFRAGQTKFIDVWPVNFFRPEMAYYFDTTCLFELQLACILHMVSGWNKHTKIRIFMCVQGPSEDVSHKKKKLSQLLTQLRIEGDIKTVNWEHITSNLPADSGASNLPSPATQDESGSASSQPQPPGGRSYISPFPLPTHYLEKVNEMVKTESQNTAVSFFYLPRPPSDETLHRDYLNHLDILTQNLPPSVLVHGLHAVTSTTL